MRTLLDEAGIESAADDERGFDHGTFVPLKLAYPDADVPAIQLSLTDKLDPAEHIAIGQALAPLRDEGVFIVASGMTFHNLRAFRQPGGGAGGRDLRRLAARHRHPAGRRARRAAWSTGTSRPAARLAHPREEHLLPLMVAAGAAGDDRGVVGFNGNAFGVAPLVLPFRRRLMPGAWRQPGLDCRRISACRRRFAPLPLPSSASPSPGPASTPTSSSWRWRSASPSPDQGQAYEKLTGRFFGELDPKHPLNAIITDIEHAPRNARGLVEYSATFTILKPVDMSKGTGVLVYQVPNRGRANIEGGGYFADFRARGHVLVASGWQADIRPGAGHRVAGHADREARRRVQHHRPGDGARSPTPPPAPTRSRSSAAASPARPRRRASTPRRPR